MIFVILLKFLEIGKNEVEILEERRFPKNFVFCLISKIKFDNLSPDYSLRVPNQKIYLFGFCRVGEDILVWNQSLSGNEMDVELDQYIAEFIFSRKEFEKEIN